MFALYCNIISTFKLFGHRGTALAQGSYCFLNYALIKHKHTARHGICDIASSAVAMEAALITSGGFWPTLRMKALKYFFLKKKNSNQRAVGGLYYHEH